MQHGWIVRLIVLVAIVALALPGAPPATAGKKTGGRLTVERAVPLRDDGTSARVSGRIACPAGDLVALGANLLQGRGEQRTLGADWEILDCAGGELAWAVVIDGVAPPGADISGGPFKPGRAKVMVNAAELSGAWQATTERGVKLVRAD